MVDRLAIGDPRRGHHVAVQWEGWRNARPAQFADRAGRRWTVRQVLDHWRHPDHDGRERKVPYGVEAQRWHLVVVGPLPYTPDQVGEQRVALRTFNDGAGWYLLVDEAGEEGRPEDVSETS